MMKIAKSLSMVVLVVVAAAAVTKSYFADTGQVLGSSTSAGNIDIQLANTGGSYGDNVTGTWSSPSNLKPGDTFEATLSMKNVGSADIHWAYFNFKDIVANNGTTSPQDAQDFAKQIEVTSITDSTTGYTDDSIGNFSTYYDQNTDGKLSLWELVNGDDFKKSNNTPSDLRLWNGDVNGNARVNHPLLPANGGTAGMKLKFKFMNPANVDQSNLMSKSFKFDVDVQGTTEEVVNVTGASPTPTTQN